MFYPCSENKVTDQLRSYCKADLCLCFCLCRLLVFPCSGSFLPCYISRPHDVMFTILLIHIISQTCFIFQSDDSSSTPVNKISYIDVPELNHNQYATPVVKKPNLFASLKRSSQTLSPTTAFYSSVPVPGITSEDGNNHRSVSQNNSLKRDYEIPWDLKKFNSDSLTTLNCSGSDLTMGYFANGRFYDPSPRQPVAKTEQQPEIYAPASSYSDRSNVPVLSTFAGGIPRAQSFSSTQSSASSKYDFCC